MWGGNKVENPLYMLLKGGIKKIKTTERTFVSPHSPSASLWSSSYHPVVGGCGKEEERGIPASHEMTHLYSRANKHGEGRPDMGERKVVGYMYGDVDILDLLPLHQ